MSVRLLNEDQILKRIFLLFSNDDSLKIFLNSKDGLDASSSSYLKLGIPAKTYYSKLKKIMDLGLIEKRHGLYLHTTFGNIFYQKFLLSLPFHIKRIDQYMIVDTLKNSNKFSQDDINRFLSNIFKNEYLNTFHSPGINDVINYSSNNVKLSFSYEDMVPELHRAIESSNHEILIATRLFDEKLFNAINHKGKSGIKVKVLSDKNLVREYYLMYERFFDAKNDKHRQDRIRNIENPWINDLDVVERRVTQVPFGLIIIDEHYIGFEIINQYGVPNFNMGILIQDKSIAITMKRYYNDLWNMASV